MRSPRVVRMGSASICSGCTHSTPRHGRSSLGQPLEHHVLLQIGGAGCLSRSGGGQTTRIAPVAILRVPHSCCLKKGLRPRDERVATVSGSAGIALAPLA